AAARKRGISVAIFQHGGFVGVCRHLGWDIADLALGDISFTYGDGVTRYFESRQRRSHRRLARPISVGSARLDTVAQGIPQIEVTRIRRRLTGPRERPIVLFIPTAMMGYSRQLCRDAYVDMTYFEFQLRIFKLFGARSELSFVYKPFMNIVQSPLYSAFRSLCQTGRWTLRPALTKLMWAADLIVVDFPGTALLEAVLTTKPIIAFADRDAVQLTNEARDLLPRRVVLAETEDAFMEALRKVTITPLTSTGLDTAFESAFARFNRDGRSAERAVELLLTMTADFQASPPVSATQI